MYRKYREVRQPVEGRCDKCGRPATHPSVVGRQCNAALPDGYRCSGMIRALKDLFSKGRSR